VTERANSLAMAALLAAACCIALAPIMVKVSELGPQASAAWRLLLALPALAVWAALERRGSPTATQLNWPLLGLAGLWFGLDLVTWHAGIVRTSAANATFLANLTPVVVLVGTWALTRKAPSPTLTVVVAVALFGGLLMSGGAPGLDATKLLGDGLSALTAVWYALYLVTVARLRGAAGAGTIMLVSTAGAAMVALTAVRLSGEAFWPQSTISGWAPLLVLGLVSHVGGQGLLAWALGKVEAQIAAIIILIQPVVAGLIGWVWLGEVLGPLQLAGGALVLLAVWQARQLAAKS
jgi:drug/metabolite transporter (DMT)-like permease